MGKKKFSERAQNAAKDLVLARILLQKSNFERNYPNRPNRASVKLDLETGVFENKPESILFRCRFKLTAKNEGSEDNHF